MRLAERLEELASELEMFVCRPRTLAGDLVLFGLATDVFETATSVMHTVASPLPHKAYSNARLAFEGAQNLLVLSTHETYEMAGPRAWVCFEARSAVWRAASQHRRNPQAEFVTDEELLKQRVNQMARVWDSICDFKGRLLRDALVVVWQERKKRPDNWLHENMTKRQHRAYELFAASGRGAVSADTAAVNQAMYEVLCHEMHAHPRLDSFGIISDQSRQTIRIDRLPRDMEAARYAVTSGTELAVWEAVLGLRWQRAGVV